MQPCPGDDPLVLELEERMQKMMGNKDLTRLPYESPRLRILLLL